MGSIYETHRDIQHKTLELAESLWHIFTMARDFEERVLAVKIPKSWEQYFADEPVVRSLYMHGRYSMRIHYGEHGFENAGDAQRKTRLLNKALDGELRATLKHNNGSSVDITFTLVN